MTEIRPPVAPTARFIPPEPMTTIWARPTTMVTAAPLATTWRLSTVPKDRVVSQSASPRMTTPMATPDGPAVNQRTMPSLTREASPVSVLLPELTACPR